METVDKLGTVFIRMLVARMKELGVTKSALARRMNVSRCYITNAFNGKANFTFASACHFAKALEMDFFPTLTKKAVVEKKKGK